MRVTYVHYLHRTVAALMHTQQWAAAFGALGHTISMHGIDRPTLPSTGVGATEGRPHPLHYAFHELNTLRKNVGYYRRECRLLAQERPDVLIARYKLYHVSSVYAARRQRVPLVVWIDAPAAYEQRRYARRFLQLPGIANRAERLLLERADGLILTTDEIKRYLAPHRRDPATVHTVSNGADTARFHPQLDGRAVRALFPVQAPIVAGFVGGFLPWHGLRGLEQLARAALAASPSACLLMVGDGPERPALEARLRQGPWDARRIHWAGHVPHARVPEHVAAIDIGLLPYDQGAEGFYFSPMKLFEYMACGKAVLAPALGQMRQVLRDGVNGLCYAADDLAQAESSLRRLIADEALRARLGAAAHQTILAEHTWRHAAERGERALSAVLEAHRRAAPRRSSA